MIGPKIEEWEWEDWVTNGKTEESKEKRRRREAEGENTKDILHSIDGKPSPFWHAKMCCYVKLGRNDDILLPKV